MANICPDCRTRNPRAHRFCSQCGAPLTGEAWDAEAPPVQEPAPPVEGRVPRAEETVPAAETAPAAEEMAPLPRKPAPAVRVPPPAPPRVPAPPVEEPKGRKRGGGRWWLVIAAVAVVVCLCGIVAVALLGGGADTTDTAGGPVVKTATEIPAEDTVPPEEEPTEPPAATEAPEPTEPWEDTPVPTEPPVPTDTPIPTETPVPKDTPIPPTPTEEIEGLVKVGTHLVGTDIEPGIYVGLAGESMLESCYWARLSNLTGSDDILANDNAQGLFYVEVLPGDMALNTACELVPIERVPARDEFLTVLPPGTYLVGRDIKAGTYRGEAGADLLESCYWSRLSNVSGTDDILANENATGQYFIEVLRIDYALKVGCEVKKVE